MSETRPFVIRMFKERNWLANNLQGLRKFMASDQFKELDEDTRYDLLVQEQYMHQYERILVKRIRAVTRV